MSTIKLSHVTVSSNYASRSEGWLEVDLGNGQVLSAFCPDNTDNWAQGTKRICHPSPEQDQQTLNVETLLLQTTQDGHYIVLQAKLAKPAMPMTYARPANEHIFLELTPAQQSVFSPAFLSIAGIIFVALYGLKLVLEKYLLPKL